MSKPKKWIEATAIEQITAGARVRFTHYESAPVEFTALSAGDNVVWAPTEHSFNFDREGRTWFIRNPEWVKPQKGDDLHAGRSAGYWANRFTKQLQYNKELESKCGRRRERIAELEAELAVLKAQQIPIDPDTIKVGDRVRVHDYVIGGIERECTFTANKVTGDLINSFFKKYVGRTWFMVTPAPEPVMPPEPPARTPWRVKGGDGSIFFQFAEGGMHANLQYADLYRWFNDLVKPGDEIELLEFRPVGEGE